VVKLAKLEENEQEAKALVDKKVNK